VLIVEDEWLQAEHVAALLTSRGYTVCGEANSGENAICLAAAERPDVVLMDVNLSGGVDGIEAARRIKSERPCGMIFLTSYTDRETTDRMRQIDPDAILRKPPLDFELMTAIERAAPRDSSAASQS
jgi:CheY-like chemotaxis protein